MNLTIFTPLYPYMLLMLNLVEISLMVLEKRLKNVQKSTTDDRRTTNDVQKKRRTTTEKKEKASTHYTDNFYIF